MNKTRLGGVGRGRSGPFRWRRGARRSMWLRAGIALLALASGVTGVSALFEPRAFFFGFPGLGRHWVAELPPYNEHLVTDVGGLFLGFTVLFVWAAVTLDVRLLRATLVGWLAFSVPHLIFHLRHVAGLEDLDRNLQTVTLSVLVVIPLILLVFARGERRRGLGL